MNLTITHQGVTYQNASAQQLLARGVPQEAIDDAVAARTADDARREMRRQIDVQAGDMPSLVGTTADTAALALLGTLAVAAAAAEATTPDEWLSGTKTRLDALGQDLGAQADAFLSAVASGTVRVPALVKGLEAVTAEISERSSAVADVLVAASPGGGTG